MSLTYSEHAAVLSAYAFALCGGVPPFDYGRPTHISAALSLGAWHRTDPPLNLHTNADIVAAVERMLADVPDDEDEEKAPDSHDPTANRLAGYAEGRHEELDMLEAWTDEEERRGNIGPNEIGALRATIEARRAMAPKPVMTALGVLARVEKWRTEAGGPMRLVDFCADLRREIEGGGR